MIKKIFALCGLALLAVSCAPMTPQSRIDADPGKFSALSPKQQALVREGKIDRGMGKDAVLIAWGSPASRFDGYQKNHRVERWDYAGSKPVFTSGFGYGGFYGSYGYGYGRRGGYAYYPYAVAPEVVYVPYTKASVSFVNGRVDSWERQK